VRDVVAHRRRGSLGLKRLEGFQIWVNLPARLKMTKPRYQDVPSAQIPEVKRPDGSRIRVIAGLVEGVAGAVSEIYADPTYLDVTLQPGSSIELPTPAGHVALLYVFRGQVVLGEVSVPSPRLVILGEGDIVRARAADEGTRFLFLSAQPLEEPYVRWGPFVMNTQEEVQQALRELREGTFIRK
jgi:quercetin 2,3-dioxygenase